MSLEARAVDIVLPYRVSITVHWYAIEFPGTNTFGIVDFFPHNNGRAAHIAGKVAEALFGAADKLLTGAPEIVHLNVLAAKV